VWIPGAGSQAFDLLYVKRQYGIPVDQAINTFPGYGKLFEVLPYAWNNPYANAANFRSAGSYDVFGTSFDNLPGIKNVKTGKDIYAYIGSALGGDYCIAFGTAYGVKCIAGGDGGAMAVQSSWYGVGLLQGVLIGTKAATNLTNCTV